MQWAIATKKEQTRIAPKIQGNIHVMPKTRLTTYENVALEDKNMPYKISYNNLGILKPVL